jgi:Na+-translocating ferredoxin:NAD+ oxidoreductase RnfG subunit
MLKSILTISALFLLLTSSVFADAVYQQPQAFLQEVFNGKVPKPRMLWLTSARRAVIKEILGHKAHRLRIRYWKRDGRTAWILEEIGKEYPITTGIVVKQGRIERLKVLIFRESRGWEVRYPFFTKQFSGTLLTADNQLNRHIDGITGATLSVRALKKLARLSLYLSKQSNKGKR